MDILYYNYISITFLPTKNGKKELKNAWKQLNVDILLVLVKLMREERKENHLPN